MGIQSVVKIIKVVSGNERETVQIPSTGWIEYGIDERFVGRFGVISGTQAEYDNPNNKIIIVKFMSGVSRAFTPDCLRTIDDIESDMSMYATINTDEEIAHSEADKMLCDLVQLLAENYDDATRFQAERIVEHFKKINKWYA